MSLQMSRIGVPMVAAVLAAGLVLGLPRALAAQSVTAPLISISVNAGTQGEPGGFTTTAVRSINREDSDLTARYALRSGSAFDIGGAVRVFRGLRLGVAVSMFEKTGDASVTAAIPHPFFFDRARALEGTAGATRSETAVHIQAQWALPSVNRFEVVVLGGPTYASVKQDLVSDITYTETFPFDTATFSGASVIRGSKSAIGGHVGVDVGLMLTRTIGVGALVRFSRTSVQLDVPSGSSVSIKAGGLYLGGGLRAQF